MSKLSLYMISTAKPYPSSRPKRRVMISCQNIQVYIPKGLVIIYQGGWGGVIQNFKE
jgi:hypothetical protein